MKRTRSVLLGLSFIYLLNSPRLVIADTRCRVATLIEEIVDGQSVNGQRVQSILGQLFSEQKNAFVVDSQHTQNAQRIQANIHGSDEWIPHLMTQLDVDLLIVGQARFEAINSGLRNLSAYSGTAHARLLTSDSGQLLSAHEESSLGRHHSNDRALQQAARHMGKKLFERFRPQFERACSGERIYELVLHLTNKTDPSATAKLIKTIKGLDLVDSAQLITQDHHRIIVEVESGANVLALGQAMSGADSGLHVHSMSGRRLEADFAIGEVINLELVPLEFRRGTGMRHGRYLALARELPDQIASGLASLNVFQFSANVESTTKARRSLLRKNQLGLTGQITRLNRSLRIAIQFRAHNWNQIALADQTICALDNIHLCTQQFVDKIKARAPELLRPVETHRKLSALQTPLSKNTHIRLGLDNTFDGIYPSLASHYQEHPVGVIRIHNHSHQAIHSIELSYELEGISEDISTTSIRRLSAQGTQKADIRLHLNEDTLQKRTRNQNVTLRVRAQYAIGNNWFEISKKLPVMVFDRSAHRWTHDGGRSIAAFVTHRDPLIQKLIQKADDSLQVGYNDPRARPLVLYHALRNLRYRPDPVNPVRPEEIDRVLYPTETLQNGGGDCDDLAVLYAALLEGAAIPAALVRIPGHVLVMAKLAWPPNAIGELSRDDQRFVIHDGEVWLPVETTQLASSFDAAWTTGAKAIATARSAGQRPIVINIRQAWRSGYRPNALPVPPSSALPRIDPAAVLKELLGYKAQREERIEEARSYLQSATTAETLNRAGVRLARLGQLNDALRAFTRSIDLNKRSAKARNNSGNVFLLKNNAPAALSHYENAIRFAARDERIRSNAVIAAQLIQVAEGSDQSRSTLQHHVDALCELNTRTCEKMLDKIFGQSKLTADGSAFSLHTLQAALIRTLKPPTSSPQTTKALADETPVAFYLHWLE